jgi:hypothetical protein
MDRRLVLSPTGDRICAVTRFDASVLPWFGLPRSLPGRYAFDVSSASPTPGTLEGTMEENKARRVVDALRDRGTDAQLARVGVSQFGVSVMLPDGREATWDSDGTAALEAQVMRNGVLVGYVPAIEGSDGYTEEQIISAILRTDYDEPIAYQRPTMPSPAQPLPRKGGVFRRFMDGFRYR